MRVVLCKGQFRGPISGADETLVTYATQLRAANHEPTVLLMYPHAADDQYYLRLKNAGVPVHSIASTSVRTSLSTGRKLAVGLLRTFPPSQRLVRRKAQEISTRVADRYYRECRDYFTRSKADVVHVLTPDPSAEVLIKAAHELNIPVLYQELGMPYQPLAFAAYYEQFVSALPLCSEVAALSPRLLRSCHEQLPFSLPLSVLPVTAEDLLDRRETQPKSPADDSVTFGFAARLEQLKSPMTLVEAFARVHENFADCFLRIAGVGSERQMCVASAKAAGISDRCDFSGAYTSIEAKRAFMRSLDVFVLPSLTEGTPNSIVEAMACGLPVIASDIGGVPDMVTPETGVLVPPGETAALADAMSRVASDRNLREQMGRHARKRYEEIFSPEVVLPLMLDTYRRIANGKRQTFMNDELNSEARSISEAVRHPWSSYSLVSKPDSSPQLNLHGREIATH